MNQLQVIDFEGQRVLTTAQLAESYGTEVQILTNNFNRNKERYKEGKHYISLSGQEKREFLNLHQNDLGSKNAAVLYIWTEKGAWLHAKSLNTDQAWEAYEALVDDYYRVKSETSFDFSQLSPEMQMFKLTFDAVAKVQLEAAQTKQELIGLQTTVSSIKETFLQRDENWRNKINGMMKGASYRLGGNYQELRRQSYAILEDRARCNLDKRLRNLVERLEAQGATKTQLKNTSRMDVIEADPKLKEIYTTIVKELAIGTIV